MSSKSTSSLKFLTQWALFNILGWIISLIVTIVLSYAVVNRFHPEETNMLVGFGLGLCVGISQWIFMNQRTNLSIRWIVAHALGIGLPFAFGMLILEGDISVPHLSNSVVSLMTYLACGVLCGFFVLKPIKRFTSTPGIFTVSYALIWSLSLWSFMWGGLIFVAGTSLLLYLSPLNVKDKRV